MQFNEFKNQITKYQKAEDEKLFSPNIKRLENNSVFLSLTIPFKKPNNGELSTKNIQPIGINNQGINYLKDIQEELKKTESNRPTHFYYPIESLHFTLYEIAEIENCDRIKRLESLIKNDLLEKIKKSINNSLKNIRPFNIKLIYLCKSSDSMAVQILYKEGVRVKEFREILAKNLDKVKNDSSIDESIKWNYKKDDKIRKERNWVNILRYFHGDIENIFKKQKEIFKKQRKEKQNKFPDVRIDGAYLVYSDHLFLNRKIIDRFSFQRAS